MYYMNKCAQLCLMHSEIFPLFIRSIKDTKTIFTRYLVKAKLSLRVQRIDDSHRTAPGFEVGVPGWDSWLCSDLDMSS